MTPNSKKTSGLITLCALWWVGLDAILSQPVVAQVLSKVGPAGQGIVTIQRGPVYCTGHVSYCLWQNSTGQHLTYGGLPDDSFNNPVTHQYYGVLAARQVTVTVAQSPISYIQNTVLPPVFKTLTCLEPLSGAIVPDDRLCKPSQ